MTQAINKTQANNGATIYRLAREGTWQVQPFGPLLTLAQAQAYQADLALAGMPCLVINTRAA